MQMNSKENSVFNKRSEEFLKKESTIILSPKMLRNKIIPLINRKKQTNLEPIDKIQFKITWNHLSYRVKNAKNYRLILNNINGHIINGEVTAILGPSGCGKSSLLNCICGRYKNGINGDMMCEGSKNLVIGLVPQNDYLMGELTVIETLVYASQFNSINNNEHQIDHQLVANRLIKRFGLQTTTVIKVSRLSGGQRKRLSIALEVLFSPNILILDEPTTGLDSPSSSRIVAIMIELASDRHNQIAIVCTIHQPSVSIFNSFNRIYMLSSKGQCIYNGSPQHLISYLADAGLECPPFNSPIDYLMEIACGEYGEKTVENLANKTMDETGEQIISSDAVKLSSVRKSYGTRFWKQMPILYKRSMLVLLRDPLLTIIRFVAVVATAIFLMLLYGNKVGTASGCLSRELELWSMPIGELMEKFERELALFQENIALVFNGLMVALLCGLAPVMLNFPYEMHVFNKEYHNGWYSCISYYVAKTISDIPFQLFFPIIYLGIVFTFTGQPQQFNRVFYLYVITLLLSLLAQSLGEIVSAIWMDKPTTVVFAGIMIILAMILFGGFLSNLARMPFYFRPFSWMSFLRFALESTLVALYGLHRCDYQYELFVRSTNVSALTQPIWMQYLPIIFALTNKQSNGNDSAKDVMSLLFGDSFNGNHISIETSLIITYFDLQDYFLYRAIYILSSYLVGLKVATYFILLAKLHSKI